MAAQSVDVLVADYRLPDGSGVKLLEWVREQFPQVLRLIASGKTVTQIAGQVKLSVKTISTYRSRVLEKMRMQNSAELTHYAIKNRLVE